MNNDNDKISDYELGILIFLTMLGVGVVHLPSSLTEKAGNDAWVTLVIAGGIAMLSAYLMCKVGARHAGLGFVGTLRYLFGKLAGSVMAVPVILYALVLTATELRLFAEVSKVYLLHRTPLEFIILPILILTVVLVRKGIEPIARSFGIYFVIILVSLVFLTVVSYEDVDFSNLLPLLKTPLPDMVSGVTSSIFAFSGFELLLVVFPFTRNPGNAAKVSRIALSGITVLYIIAIVNCITKLGVEETSTTVWPVMAVVKSIDMPGGFLENLEGVLTSLWVFFAFTSLVGFLFFFSVISRDVFNHKSHKHFVSMSIPLLYLLALQGNSVLEVFDLSDKAVLVLGTYTILVLPAAMLAMSFVRGKKSD